MLNEAVLRRLIGEPGLMARQLQHLLALAGKPGVSVRVIPWKAGVHGGMTAANSFQLLSFPDDPSGEPIEPPLAYVDTLTGAMYLQKPDELSAYEQVWRDIGKKALSASESKKLITSALEGFAR